MNTEWLSLESNIPKNNVDVILRSGEIILGIFYVTKQGAWVNSVDVNDESLYEFTPTHFMYIPPFK
jgi:hypothetical protein